MKAYGKEYKFIREVVLFIYDHKCSICGHQHKSNHAHHNDRNSLNNNPFNLVVLCNNCHKMAHKCSIQFDINPNKTQILLLEELNNMRCFYI